MLLKKMLIQMLIILISFVFVFVIIILIRTYTYPFQSIEIEPHVSVISDTSPLPLKRLSGGLKIPTVSSSNYESTDFKVFENFIAYLKSSYPDLYRNMETSTLNKYGLVFKWRGHDPMLDPILFLSHYDVVPSGNLSEKEKDHIFNEADFNDTLFRPADQPFPAVTAEAKTWDYPPFSGAVVNGRIYGSPSTTRSPTW